LFAIQKFLLLLLLMMMMNIEGGKKTHAIFHYDGRLWCDLLIAFDRNLLWSKNNIAITEYKMEVYGFCFFVVVVAYFSGWRVYRGFQWVVKQGLRNVLLEQKKNEKRAGCPG
jgi:hypothetical protein